MSAASKRALQHMADRLGDYIIVRQRDDDVMEGMRRARDGLLMAVAAMEHREVEA